MHPEGVPCGNPCTDGRENLDVTGEEKLYFGSEAYDADSVPFLDLVTFSDIGNDAPCTYSGDLDKFYLPKRCLE